METLNYMFAGYLVIWGLAFANDMADIEGEQAGLKVRGLVGTPGLTRVFLAQRLNPLVLFGEVLFREGHYLLDLLLCKAFRLKN